MIVSRFAIVTEDLVICCYQVTKIFSTRYGSTIASPARCPCNFCPLADLEISVLREMSMNTLFYTNPHVSWMWALKTLHERNLREIMSKNFIIHQIFCEFLQPLQDFRILPVSPFPQQRVSTFFLWFFFICFWNFTGLINIGSPRSLINRC